VAVIEARGLGISYGNRMVLENVDLDVGRGELWFLLGGNGAGKTSFVRAVLGLLRPTAGTLRCDPELAARERTGFVPQRCDLNPTLRTSLREFVSLGLVGTKTTRSDRDVKVARALARVGLEGKAASNYHSLSGGMRQRGLLARALVREPTLLILDEPTAGLDVAAEESILRLLGKLNAEQGLTALVVTHDLEIAGRYASHVALFHEGHVTAGPRAKVLSRQSLARVYGLDPDEVRGGPRGAGEPV
jgi:ABC-type Mn2+/Zn2+ transport system ATPase subunit